MIEYVQLVVLLTVVARFLARRAPVSVVVGLWLLMMCWEVYDQHPDHAVVYSVALGYAAVKAAQRDVQERQPQML